VNRITILSVLMILVFVQSCGLLNQAGEYNRFVNSTFKLEYLQILEIGGVDVSEMYSKSDLNVGEMLTLAGRVFSEEMPAKIKVYIEIENTSNEMAAISGLEWKLLMKEVEYANGILEDRVEVEPNSKVIFPVDAEIDLMKVFKSESLFDILKLVFNINDEEQLRNLQLELKIKPYYKSGSGLKKYPAYISLKP